MAIANALPLEAARATPTHFPL